MKFKNMIVLTSIMITSIFAQDNIISEIGDNGKFIVRDTDLKESMVIEDGDVTIYGGLKLEALPKAESGYSYVVWDPRDKQLKISRTMSIDTPIELKENGWHNIGFEEVDDGGNIISASTMSTNAIRWNEFNTDYGYIKLGPAGPWGGHIYTNRQQFIFNKKLYLLEGQLAVHSGQDIDLITYKTPRVKILASNGNVGIGTETPTAKLEVVGQVKITGGSPGSGKVLTSDGTGLATWQTPASGGGSGLWFESGDNVYRLSGNVGIGTSSPATKLEVAGSAVIGDNSSSSYLHVGNNYFSSNSGTLNPGLYLYKNGSIAYGLKLQSTNGEYGTMMFGPNISNTHLSFGKTGNALQDDNMVEYMRIDLDNGNVGIGTKTPMVKLDVDGTACVTRYGTKSVHSITNGTWDLSKGNIAEVNFGSSITPITINSDNCVGTYVLIVKKSSSCSSCSVDIQGANILWAYGVPPTLSSGSNTTDIISLIAVGNDTFYGYTANNFY